MWCRATQCLEVTQKVSRYPKKYNSEISSLGNGTALKIKADFNSKVIKKYVPPPFTLFEKSIFCPKIQLWQNPNIFTSFSPKYFFLTIFLVKSKLLTAKKSKTTTFSRVFRTKKIDNFLGKSKLNFWTKNEDMEQCE